VPCFEDVYESLPADGWLTKDEAQLLYETVESITSAGTILEVGAFKGRSTALLASFGRLVHVVDPFEGFSTEDPTGIETRNLFLRNMDDRGLMNSVCLWSTRIEDFNLDIVKKCVMAYLDGDHTRKGTEAQINTALKLNAQVIAVHDVNDEGDGLQIKQACLERLGPWTKRVGRLAVWDRRIKLRS